MKRSIKILVSKFPLIIIFNYDKPQDKHPMR